MIRTYRPPVTLLLGAAVALMASLSVYLVSTLWMPPVAGSNPFDYNLAPFRSAAGAPVLFRETARIATGLAEPRALATAADGQLFVAGDRQIRILGHGKSTAGQSAEGWALPAPPTALAVSAEGEIYVAMDHRVVVFHTDSRMVREWPELPADSRITSLAPFGTDVFVADAGRREVLRCSRSGQVRLRSNGRDPESEGPGFIVPSPYFDLAVAADGFLWVVNPGRHRLEDHAFDGRLRSSWGGPGAAPASFCGCCNPTHFLILADGGFVTSEKGLPRVKLYSPAGEFVGWVAPPDAFTEGTAGLDLAAGSDGCVLVLDPAVQAVRVFTRLKME